MTTTFRGVAKSKESILEEIQSIDKNEEKDQLSPYEDIRRLLLQEDFFRKAKERIKWKQRSRCH